MKTFFFKRAIQDLRSNIFLHLITLITITLSVLIVSTFTLFISNANEILNTWKKGIRIIVYIEDGVQKAEIDTLKREITRMEGVSDIRFIPKETALKQLEIKMKSQNALLENLRENPLPDALEVWISPEKKQWEAIEMMAIHIESSHLVADVEYGQNWLKKFTGILNLFRFTGILMSVVFFMAAVFIVANTIRLLFFSRHEELKIMQLVGATDRFIKAPFYIEGILQGAAGGMLGLCILYLAFLVMLSSIDLSFTSYFFEISFIPGLSCIAIIICSMLAGWLGCYISLKQFLNN
ncbi:MAG: permease-like cell division protein FtsX [Thermodesulfobacteriota bacterium]|nr:permease-like cell division protein FtsX [Thermodesulfobacteriota bacterium]